MRFLGILCFTLILLLICDVAIAEEWQPSELLKLIPNNAMTLIMLKNKKDDIGLKAIKDALKDKFSIEKSAERQKVVEEMSMMFNVEEIIGAAFYARKEKPLFMLLISVGTDDKKLIEDYSSKINILFNNPSGIWYEEHSGYKIIYNPERFQKPDNKDFSCYTILENSLVLSNEYGLLKKIIDNYLGQRGSILDSDVFLQLPLVTEKEADGLIYISNLNKELTNSINSWKEEIGFVPLISSDLIQSLWFSFDIVDDDTVKGMITFVPNSKESNSQIINDASFLIDAMGRKFMAEDMTYEKEIDIVDDNIVLSFKLRGLANLWEKLMSDDFDENNPVQSSAKIISQENSNEQTNMVGPALFFIIIAIVIALGVLKRKSKK